MPAASGAAGAAVGEEPRRQYEQPGVGVEIARTAGGQCVRVGALEAGLAGHAPARTWAGVLLGLAELPNAQASMLPGNGLYVDAPSVPYVQVVAPAFAW